MSHFLFHKIFHIFFVRSQIAIDLVAPCRRSHVQSHVDSSGQAEECQMTFCTHCDRFANINDALTFVYDISPGWKKLKYFAKEVLNIKLVHAYR